MTSPPTHDPISSTSRLHSSSTRLTHNDQQHQQHDTTARFSFHSQAWDEDEDDEDNTAKAGPSQPRVTPSLLVQRPSHPHLYDAAQHDERHKTGTATSTDLSRWQESAHDDLNDRDFGDDFGLAPATPDIDRTVTSRRRPASSEPVKSSQPDTPTRVSHVCCVSFALEQS